MYFQDEVDGSGKKCDFFPPGDLENCICRIANNLGILLHELTRTFHGYAMNGYSDNVNGRDGEFQTFQLLQSK